MQVNANKPERWKQDIANSVDFYNDWFIQFAPAAYQESRVAAMAEVTQAFEATTNLTRIEASQFRAHPRFLMILRMATAPPLARDRLIGLSGVRPNLVRTMEQESRLPPRTPQLEADRQLERVARVIQQLLDRDLFPWLAKNEQVDNMDVLRAATVVADRLTGAIADPIIRNSHERRQLSSIREWLVQRGYREVEGEDRVDFREMNPGTFSFRLNVSVEQALRAQPINIPIDVVIKSHTAGKEELPLLIEAKSAGDFTNPNKRRKEEATKMAQLRSTYGDKISFILLLCGYFDTGYLGYEAAEGIDWVWEHRLDELAQFGL